MSVASSSLTLFIKHHLLRHSICSSLASLFTQSACHLLRAKINAGTDGIVETKYLENLNDPTTSMFPDGLDTTASAVLAAARTAAAKIIAEENGKLEPEDDDPDTIKLSQEAKMAMLKKRQMTLEDGTIVEVTESTEHLFFGPDGKPLLMTHEDLGADGLPKVKMPHHQQYVKGSEEVDIAAMGSDDFFHIPDTMAPLQDRTSGSGSKKKGISSKSKNKKSSDGKVSFAEGGGGDDDDAAGNPETDGPGNSFLFFEDQNLTEREKDLIHRAYLAGVASKGNLDERNKTLLLKGGRGKKGGVGGKRGVGVGGGVQWDFSGLDDEDPSMLSSSLLNMSMDKDIIMEEMGLSLSDKSVLTRPLSHGAMQSLQGFGGGGADEDGLYAKRRGGPKMSPTAR